MQTHVCVTKWSRDTQLGERYAIYHIQRIYHTRELKFMWRFINADHVLLSVLQDFEGDLLVISYDIACQYQPKFERQIQQYPEHMRKSLQGVTVKHVIPMFHLLGHGQKCHNKYNPYTTPFIARTDRENIEQGWAHINPAATSTREMGKGSQHETLDNHFGNFNWEQLIALGTYLLDLLIILQKVIYLSAQDQF